MYAFTQDLRFAFRQLRKAPGVSLTVVLTLALGIGATTAIFSLVEGILLRPLPFSDPERLVLLGDHLGDSPGITRDCPRDRHLLEGNQRFCFSRRLIYADYELSGGATPEEVMAARFTARRILHAGVQSASWAASLRKPGRGRHQPLAVISYALWLNRYHRNPNILGSSIVLDRKAYTIIGVMPRSFEFPLESGHLNQAQLWVPMSLTAEELPASPAFGDTTSWPASRMASASRRQRRMPTASPSRSCAIFPPARRRIHIRGDVMPLREYAVSGVQPLLRTLFLAVSVVLLIACVNVAGLLLVRAIRRRREYAVRLALGAGSSVIIRESVLEGLLLSVAGGTLGLAFAAIAIRTALHLLPESMPRIDSISMERHCRWLRPSARLDNRRSVQPSPRLCGLEDQPDRKPQRGRAHRHRGCEPYLAAISPGSLGDCDRAGAAHRFGRLFAKFPENARRRSWISA